MEVLIEGYCVLVGRDALENHSIIRRAKRLDQNAWWFHLESVSSAHIIMFIDDPKMYLNVIKDMLFERTRKAPRSQRMIYTRVKNVSCTDIPGGVITKRTERY